MSLRVYIPKHKEKLKLHSKPFASGGEGQLYRILSPSKWSNHVVKIYHPSKRSLSRQEKIRYLLAHPPQKANNHSVTWVTDVAQDKEGNFLGIVMPFIQGEKLEILCTPKLPKKLANTWYRFHLDSEEALDLRLKICYNLAAAIHQIHSCNRYILVDLKPDNVIITTDGLVSLVDLDSVEVVENGQKLFDAPVATPEYTPPEFYQEKEHDPTQQQAWDRFSLVVIFYKLLMGIHPFAGSFAAPYDQYNTLADKIKEGLFIHNPKLKKLQKSIPPPHQTFFKLPTTLQDLFNQCFVQGHSDNKLRPTAHEWCSAIMQHQDLNRVRALPSQMITMPIGINELQQLQEQNLSPQQFLDKLSILPDNDESQSLGPLHPLPFYIKVLRKVNLGLLSLGIVLGSVYIISNPATQTIGIIILMVTFILSTVIIFISFLDRNNVLLLQKLHSDLLANEKFLLKQENIFNGVQQHLASFFTKLSEEHRSLFSKKWRQNPDNLTQAIQEELNRLETDLALHDKNAQQVIDSEEFDYRALKGKYNRALHTHPSFVKATSLDSELAAIDFALQEELEDLHKTLGKSIKTTQLEYDQIFEQQERELSKQKRALNRKIGQHKKQLDLAKKQEKKKLLIQMQRQLVKEAALVDQHIDTRLTLFKDEIVSFLSQHKITNLRQIQSITPPGLIQLDSGKTISIAPLRYYQIHELREWWLAVTQGKVTLPNNLVEKIDARYQQELADFKKIEKEYFAEFATKHAKRKQDLEKEARIVYKQLRQNNTPKILAVKKKHEEHKAFLMQLYQERDVEEQTIHSHYEEQFDNIIQAAQKKADLTHKRIQQISQLDTLNSSQVARYHKNLKKYKMGLKRLEEEHNRLKDTQERYLIAQENLAKKEEITLAAHLEEMFFLK